MKHFTPLLCLSALILAGCDTQNPQQEASISPTNTTPLTAARLHASPSLSGPVLSRPQISPDGLMVTVLQGRDNDANQQDLWAYDLNSGTSQILVNSTDLLGAPEILSAEEKNRRERARETGTGIVSYSWDSKSEQILFPLGGDIYLYNLVEKSARQVTDTDGFETDARISPSGRYVSYVRANELYVTNLQNGDERRLSYGATDLIRNATASFVVQEELARSTGYWMSPNERYIAYSQIDESPVVIEQRIEFSAQGVENVAQRYPFAGTDNVTVKLAIVPTNDGEPIWVDIGDNPDIYLARVYWSADSSEMYVSILSRDHKSLKMLSVNPTTGASNLMFEETSSSWINVRGSFKALKDGGFLWSSERDGFHHLYRYAKGGTDVTQLTKGNWPIGKIECVDEKNANVYFSGWQKSALNRHIYRVSFDGSNLTQISEGEGRHSASFAKNCAAYIGTFSNKATPPQTRAYDNTGAPLIWLNENKLDDSHAYAPYLASHIAPQFGQLDTGDGTKLDYALYTPADIKPGEKRAAITIVYAGPLAQRVHNGWDAREFLIQLLVDKGFVVFKIDGRGAGNRGKAFENHLYRSMGKTEIVDQVIGAEFLKRLRFVDAERMGVYGWSYGGYMVLHMLAQTDIYAAGVSGAPVTDWALYDTAYTERYLGDPRPDHANYTQGAYETASVFAHLDGLEEPFLLIHGMADDNVVFRHSIKLMDEIQKLGRHNMEVMVYPGEKHGFRNGANKTHRDQQIVDFFVKELTP